MSTRSVDTIRLIFGDQLSHTLATLNDIDPARDIVLMAEVMDECTYVPHHPKKIALILSAMRHFAAALRDKGVEVRYVTLDDDANTGTLEGEVARAVKDLGATRVVVTEPGEWRLFDAMQSWADTLGISVDIRADDRFIVSKERFAAWADGRKLMRMEDFYREVRKSTGLLMQDGDPEGGRWNFDKENRKPLKDGVTPPQPHRVPPDQTTEAVLALVEDRFDHHFGTLRPFHFAVTYQEAERAFEHFIEKALPNFGDYQDAMVAGEPTLFHAVCGLYLNIGLLDPLAMCQAAEKAYGDGHAPLNAVEGFIRQVIGWREYVRGIYWHHMPSYGDSNALGATRDLPDMYWGAETELACMRACVEQTRDEAYAHHIQRLMVTGNFAMLAGIEPSQVQAWYLAVYADAFEWVEMPNTHGMAIYADGGIMATKPYAAGGRYIQKMSNYCKGCRFDPTDAVGDDACPFSYLYWDFLIRNRDVLGDNHRLRTIYSSLDRMTQDRVTAMQANATRFLDAL
tara:strand:+ start:834 stop:2369 length:1536 start_codon:yes stop_codon:yes gene_type:complete